MWHPTLMDAMLEYPLATCGATATGWLKVMPKGERAARSQRIEEFAA